MPDEFWTKRIALEEAARGKQADPSACGTCRDNTTRGETVKHDECAQRAHLLEPPDMPDWEILTKLTDQQKADLPARFHIPVYDDCGVPNAWLCKVCQGDEWVTGWPCATAMKTGTKVFTPAHEAEREEEKRQAELVRRCGEVDDLRAELRQAREQAAALEERRLALQEANEGAYRAAYDASGGARFDKPRPFGRLTEPAFSDPAKRAAFRMLQRPAAEGKA